MMPAPTRTLTAAVSHRLPLAPPPGGRRWARLAVHDPLQAISEREVSPGTTRRARHAVGNRRSVQ